MTRIALVLLALAGSSLSGPGVRLAAAQDFDQIERVSWGHTAIRVAQNYVLREGETVHDVFVVWGPATINGHVTGDITVVFGSLELGPSAVIDQSLVVVGGTARVTRGAMVRQHIAVVGGGIEGPPDFLPGRDHFVIGSADLFDRLKVAVPWLTQGLMMGRPIAPGVQWVWGVVTIVFMVSLLLCLIFLNGVRQCASAVATRPLSTFLIGLLVMLITGPLAVILAASVIGIAVLPFLFCALIIAWTIGKVGVAMWIGSGVADQQIPVSRLRSVIAFVLGFAVLCFVYSVPVLGFIVWGLIGVMGLGAATVAFTTAYRRENPKVRKGAPLPPPPSPPPAPAPEPPPQFFDSPPLDPAPRLDTPLPPSSSMPGAAAAAPSVASASSGAPFAPGPLSQLLYFPRATFLDRLGAFAIDVALVLILKGALDIHRDEDIVIWFLLIYHVVFWTWKGTTVGGMICQVRVVRIDGQPMRLADAVVRALVGVLSIGAFGIGCFWILRDPERQAWHDKIAGTYVVKVPRTYPVTS
jgi:uncharacterized RDD family membrane protein YckC